MSFHPGTVNVNAIIIFIVLLATRPAIGVAIQSAFISDGEVWFGFICVYDVGYEGYEYIIKKRTKNLIPNR
jgi:hypothetical protein